MNPRPSLWQTLRGKTGAKLYFWAVVSFAAAVLITPIIPHAAAILLMLTVGLFIAGLITRRIHHVVETRLREAETQRLAEIAHQQAAEAARLTLERERLAREADRIAHLTEAKERITDAAGAVSDRAIETGRKLAETTGAGLGTLTDATVKTGGELMTAGRGLAGRAVGLLRRKGAHGDTPDSGS